jgi:hypothetical protein
MFTIYSINICLCHSYNKNYNSLFKCFYSTSNKFTNEYKKEYELTKEQREALIGILIADGHLEKGKPT